MPMHLLAAKVWTYWIGPFVLIGTIGLVVGIAVLYLVKVVSLKYPRR
jgi:hypothetical protein